MAHSDDGLRWTAYPENPVLRHWSDTANNSYKMMNDEKRINYRLGLATVKRGRLVGYHAPPEAGDKAELLTRPFVLDKPQLRINADAAKGEVRAALTTEDGTPIHKCSIGECQPIRQDGLALPIRWRRRSDLSDLVGKKVRLRMRAKNATRYGLSTA